MDLTSRPEVKAVFKKLVKRCEDLYDLYSKSEYRAAKIKESESARRAYAQTPVVRAFPWDDASNVCLPLTTITVDNLEPRIVAGLIGRDPYVSFQMVGMEKKDDATIVLEDWFNKELKDRVKLENKTTALAHDLLLDGTVFPIALYSCDERVVRDFVYDQQGQVVMEQEQRPQMTGQDPMTGQPIIQMVSIPTGIPKEEDVTISCGEGGRLDFAPYDTVLFPDDVGTQEEWEEADIIVMKYFTYADLVEHASKKKAGYMDIGPWLLAERDTAQILLESQATGAQKVDGVEVTGKEVIECMECHVKYPIYQEEEMPDNEQTNWTNEKVIITIAKRSGIPIRFMLQRSLNFENKKIIKRIRLYPESGKSYGTSIYGKMKSIQDGATDLFNSIQDTLFLTMIPWFFYEDKAGLKGEVDLRPGKGVKVDSVGGVMFPKFQINADHYLNFLNLLMSLWERVGSIGDLQIGRPSDLAGKNKTATEIMAVIEEGNIKHNYQARVTREEYIELLRTIYDLYYQNMPANKTFAYQGQEAPIPRRAMKRDMQFVLSGSTELANKLIDRKEKEQILQMFGGDPFIDPIKVREDVLKAYKYNDAQEYINPDFVKMAQAMIQNPELMEVVGKYLQTKAQVGQQITGGQMPPGGGGNAGPAIQ